MKARRGKALRNAVGTHSPSSSLHSQSLEGSLDKGMRVLLKSQLFAGTVAKITYHVPQIVCADEHVVSS